jgi:bifunctional oligoribonuclease and PAP phosphatase NrnA
MKDKLIELIQNKRTFEILTHELPDEDAVGSTSALAHALSMLGKKAGRIYPTAIVDQYIISPVYKDYLCESPEVSFLLDVSNLEMLGNIKPRGVIAVIDHHKSNNGYGDISWVDPKYSSTCEMIYDLLYGFVSITPVIASNLYMGIFGDTGGFTHTNIKPRIFEIVHDLTKSGADAYSIALKLKRSKTLWYYKLLCCAMERLSIKGNVFGTYITKDDLGRIGASPQEASGIVDEIASIGGSELSIFLRDADDGIVRCSMRSRTGPAALMTALSFGGGGHERAAGFSVKGKASLMLNSVMEEGSKWI